MPLNEVLGHWTQSRESSAANRGVYGSLAREYEEKSGLHRPNIAKQVRRFAHRLPSNPRVLDLGCGVGVALAEMQAIGFSPTGIDIAPEMVRLAARRAPFARLVCGDFLTHDFVGRFDGVYAQSVIHLFSDAELHATFEKIRKVLRTDGCLFISTTESLSNYAGMEPKRDYNGGPIRYRRHWTYLDFSNLLASEGFRVVDDWRMIDPFQKKWMLFIAVLHRDSDSP